MQPNSRLTGGPALALFDAQPGDRHLNPAARYLRAAGHGLNTIGSSGHEANAGAAGRRGALGGYLCVLRRITAPTRLTVRQGEDLGRPGELLVDADPADEQAKLTGRAVPHTPVVT